MTIFHGKTYFFLLFLMIIPKVISQTIIISIPCTDTIKSIYLTDYWGDNYFVLDTAFRNETGNYIFSSPQKNYQDGLYSIRFTKESRIDIIINQEDIINIELCPHDILHTIKVKQSKENEVYYNFIKQNVIFNTAIKTLETAINQYPKAEGFYDSLTNKYLALQIERIQTIDKIVSLYPNYYASKIIGMSRTPIIDAKLNSDEKIQVLRENFFYGINFNDESLLRSNIYPTKIFDFLQLYADPNFSQEEFEEAMKIASSRLLTACSQNEEVFSFVYDFLYDGFKSYKLDNMLNYLDENFVQQQCNDSNKNRLQQRIDAFNAMVSGTKASLFAVRNQEGAIKELSEFTNEYVFIMFYASTCSHCSDVVKFLWDKYRTQKHQKFEVVAVSLDNTERAWNKFLDDNRFTWINTFSPQGFDGYVTSSYNVYTTPMIFVLNKDKNIISKPMNLKELKKVFKDLDL